MKHKLEDQEALLSVQTGIKPRMKTPNDNLALVSLLLILIFTSGFYGLLILRDGLPVVLLILLALLWALHIYTDRIRILPTPLDAPMLALLVSLAVNLTFSVDRQSTLVRAYHLALSFSLFFAIVRLVQFRKDLPITIVCLLLLSLGAGILGLFATDWSGGVLGFLSPVYVKLPRLASIVPGASINKNTMGGALTFFPPLLLSLFWDGSAFKKLARKYPGYNKLPIWFYKLLVLLCLALVLAVIILTQSRGAWLGAAVGLYVFLVWKDKRFLWAIPTGILFLMVISQKTGISSLAEFFALLDRGQDASLQGRLDIWQRIISLTRDFPVTGVGLDALNPVYQSFFNPFLFDEPPARLYHAHNTLLSVTIEMGIPALILYVAMLTTFAAMAKRAFRGARRINKVLIMGLVCGMLAHQVFGLMDAYPLGKNLGIIMWIYFAVITALYIHRGRMIRSFPQQQDEKASPPVGDLLGQILFGLALWLMLSLIALALVRVNIYLSLLAAILAGVFLGVVSVKSPVFMKARKKTITNAINNG
jgi:O-antigen ligase